MLLPISQISQYACLEQLTQWQLIIGACLAPFFLLFGTTLLSVKLLALLFIFIAFYGWYKLISKYINRLTAYIFCVLYIFGAPFFIEKTLFLSGTHVQSGILLPYIAILILAILDEEKNPGRYPVLLGILIGAGMYLAYELYLFIFIFTLVIFIRRFAFKGPTFRFAAAFLVFSALATIMPAAARCDFYKAHHAAVFNLPLAKEHFWSITKRFQEMFLYASPKQLGMIIFLFFLSAIAWAAINSLRKKNNLIAGSLLFFFILQFLKVASGFSLQEPIGRLFTQGRYFIFGFEFCLLFTAYFLSCISKNSIGKIILLICVAAHFLCAISFLARNSAFELMGRSFPKGYHYRKIGKAILLLNSNSWLKAALFLEQRRKNKDDVSALEQEIIDTEVLSCPLQQNDVPGIALWDNFSGKIKQQYLPFFWRALGKRITMIYQSDPKRFSEVLTELAQTTTADDFRNIYAGIKTSLDYTRLKDYTYTGLIRRACLTKNRNRKTLCACAGWLFLPAPNNFYGADFARQAKQALNSLRGLSDSSKYYVMLGYFEHAGFAEEEGAVEIYRAGALYKNYRGPYKSLLADVLTKKFTPLYGAKCAELIFPNKIYGDGKKR
ncbi:MAG: glycosyltransferase family 39 protein [Candidatus Omnitrophica bacterium]|nr:glycosyltransferase family 39 protein [Candidatus Omnitrophota bacterium]